MIVSCCARHCKQVSDDVLRPGPDHFALRPQTRGGLLGTLINSLMCWFYFPSPFSWSFPNTLPILMTCVKSDFTLCFGELCFPLSCMSARPWHIPCALVLSLGDKVEWYCIINIFVFLLLFIVFPFFVGKITWNRVDYKRSQTSSKQARLKRNTCFI